MKSFLKNFIPFPNSGNICYFDNNLNLDSSKVKEDILLEKINFYKKSDVDKIFVVQPSKNDTYNTYKKIISENGLQCFLLPSIPIHTKNEQTIDFLNNFNSKIKNHNFIVFFSEESSEIIYTLIFKLLFLINPELTVIEVVNELKNKFNPEAKIYSSLKQFHSFLITKYFIVNEINSNKKKPVLNHSIVTSKKKKESVQKSSSTTTLSQKLDAVHQTPPIEEKELKTNNLHQTFLDIEQLVDVEMLEKHIDDIDFEDEPVINFKTFENDIKPVIDLEKESKIVPIEIPKEEVNINLDDIILHELDSEDANLKSAESSKEDNSIHVINLDDIDELIPEELEPEIIEDDIGVSETRIVNSYIEDIIKE